MGRGESSNTIGVVSTAVQTVFIVLKLTKVINWSWLWVLSPFWISTLLVFVIFAIAWKKSSL